MTGRANLQRSFYWLCVDPLDVKPSGGFYVRLDAFNVWHIAPGPDGRVLVVTEHNGSPVSMVEIDEDYAALTVDGALNLAVIWSRVIQRTRAVRA